MAFKCPNCGGNQVHYDIPKKQLKCMNCGELLPVKDSENKGEQFFDAPGEANEIEIDKSDLAEEHKYGVVENGESMQVISYVCKSCGAELLSPEESIVSYCSYCGSEALLQGKLTEEVRPKFILPFQKSKQQCMNAYTKHTEKMLYLPDELKNPAFLEKFRGTYIPYWLYKVDFPETSELRAVTEDVRGDEVTETTYDITAEIKGGYQGLPYDASSCFDDTISDMLMPFDKKKLIEFDPAYLAGFYADRADVSPMKYVDDVEARASINAYDSVVSSLKRQHDLDLNPVSDKRKINVIPSRANKSTTALLPIWFLTWRNKNRVAYAIVNGQSGKLSADLPVDIKKFSLATLMTAVVLFGIMTLFVSLTAKLALAICSFLTLVVMAFLNQEVKDIRDRENHIFDKGYFVKGRQVKMPEKKVVKAQKKIAKASAKNPERLKGNSILGNAAVLIMLIFSAVVLAVSWGNEDFATSDMILGITALYLLFGIWMAVSSRRALMYVREWSIRFFNLLGLLALGVAFVISYMNPPEDYYYYIGSAICGFGAAVTAFGLIKYYNLLTTRPIPTFFDREGGNDDAE